MLLLIKWVPMLLMRVRVKPNIVMMFSYMNFVATSLVHDSTCSTSTYCVTYSIVVIMYLAPILWPRLEKVPTESMAHISNVRLWLTDTRLISLYLRCLPILWHLSPFWHWDLQSLFRVGHQSLACRIFFIVVSSWKFPPTSPTCASLMIDWHSHGREKWQRTSSCPSL